MKTFLGAGLLAAAISLVAATAHAETLRDALSSAYRNNPNITSALLSVKSSVESIALARSGKLPNIGFSVSGTNAWTIANGNVTNAQSANAGLSYNQTLFDNYKTDAQIAGAEAMTRVQVYALANEEQNVLLNVVQAYMSVVRDTQLVQLRQENVAFLQRQVQSARDRLNLGEGTRLDVSQAETSQAQGVASYQSAIASLQTSQASFERWVGHKPQNLSAQYNFGGILPNTLDEAINAAINNHPAILSARAAIAASQANLDGAQAAFGPTVNLVGSLCTWGCGQGAEPGSGSIRISLSIPIYAGGALGASVRKANLDQIRSELDALAVRDQIKEAVISAWATLQNASAQIQSATTALSSSQLSLDAVIEQRDVGQSTTLDVLEAQAAVTGTRETLIAATSTRFIASFSLLSAAGRLSASELQLPVEIKSADGYAARVQDVWLELRSLD
jgi:outer membrane protein